MKPKGLRLHLLRPVGKDLPGPFRHSGVSFEALVEQLFMGTDGLFGLPPGAAASMISAFIMFGAFLERTGMNTLFIDISCLLTCRAKGAPAKVTIFASALFGFISGSARANVYGTGIVTIPLIKRVGYAPAFAGAVEARASTDGQLMPPIMGAAGFGMFIASLLLQFILNRLERRKGDPGGVRMGTAST